MVADPILSKDEFSDLVHEIARANGLTGADDFLSGGWARGTATTPESFIVSVVRTGQPIRELGRIDAARCTKAAALRFIRESTRATWPRLRIADEG